MKELTMKKDMQVSQLKEHPRNREYFADIKDSNPAFWLEFKDSIKRFGIIEPLLVNKTTKEIRSGNQRWKAAIELGIETVPVVFVDDSANDDEIGEMIASNVFRRQIDPFAQFDYIAQLRKGHLGNLKKGVLHETHSSEDVSRQIHKHNTFIKVSDVYATLTPEQRDELRAKFENDMDRNEGKLILELKKIESEKIEAMDEYQRAKAAAVESMEREKAKQEAIERLESEIIVLKSRDVEEELANRDAQIRALEKQKATLKKKLAEPDLNKVLDDCIKEQRNVSIKLADIFKHKEGLDGEKLQELGNLMAATMATIRNNGKTVLQIGE